MGVLLSPLIQIMSIENNMYISSALSEFSLMCVHLLGIENFAQPQIFTVKLVKHSSSQFLWV